MRWILFMVIALGVFGYYPGASAQAQDASTADAGSYEAFQLLLDRNIFDASRRRPIPPSERRPEPPPPPRQETFSLVGVFMNGQEKVAFFQGSDREWSGSRKVGETIADFIVREVEFSHASLERLASTNNLESDPDTSSSEISENDDTGKADLSESQAVDGNSELKDEEDKTLVVALLELPVGQGMSRRGDDPWELTENPNISGGSFGSGRSSFGRGSFGSDRNSSGGSDSGESDNAEKEDAGSDSDAGGGMSDILKQMMERRKQEINK